MENQPDDCVAWEWDYPIGVMTGLGLAALIDIFVRVFF